LIKLNQRRYITGTKNRWSIKKTDPLTKYLFSRNRAEKGGVDTRSLIYRVDEDLQPEKSIKKTSCPRARKKREGWSLLSWYQSPQIVRY
jgi:hypothetical protein